MNGELNFEAMVFEADDGSECRPGTVSAPSSKKSLAAGQDRAGGLCSAEEADAAGAAAHPSGKIKKAADPAAAFFVPSIWQAVERRRRSGIF